MIKLTPIEHELIYQHSGLPDEEKRRWHGLIEKIESTGKRVEIARQLHAILEKDFKDAIKGIANKKEPFKRISTLFTLASVPAEIGVDQKVARKIAHSEDYSKKLSEFLENNIKRIIPLEKKLTPEGSKALRDAEYLSNLFKYYYGYKNRLNNSNYVQIFQMIHKAFLEDGIEGVKKLKYDSKEFRNALPDDELREFAKNLDKAVGSVGGSSKSENFYKTIKGKLEDYKKHKEEEKENISEQIEKQQSRLEKEIENIMGEMNADNSIKALVNKRDVERLKQKKETLKGKAKKIMNALIGKTSRLATIEKEADNAKKAANIGEEIVKKLSELKNKSAEEQIKTLEELRLKYNREALEHHAEVLSSLGKPVYNDLSFFISNLLNFQASDEKEKVISKITHNPKFLFSVGKFENNCQSPGVTHSQSLLGFVAHPNELTIAHFSPDGEFIGFSFAHFLKSEESNKYALVIERPYSNHGNLKPAMVKASKKIAEKIEELAKKRKLKLKVFLKDEIPGGKYRVLPSPYLSKWYDVKGGEIGGGETV